VTSLTNGRFAANSSAWSLVVSVTLLEDEIAIHWSPRQLIRSE
jgi:hypothetical protein